MLEISATIAIDEDELEETFVRASGPGGQNVNKVSTAVQLRFNVRETKSLPDAIRVRLEQLAKSRLTKDGVLVITADRFRTQVRNREDARDRLVELVRRAMIVPKARKATKPSYGSQVRRVEKKRIRSRVKSLRRTRPDTE